MPTKKRKLGTKEKGMPYIMEEMSVLDMKKALKVTRTVVIVLGSCEQHGYHLPLSTDVIPSCHIAREAARKYPFVVAPPINYGYSNGNLPGTINLRPSTIQAIVVDLAESFKEQGFRNVIFLLGHGELEHKRAVWAGCQELLVKHRDPDFRAVSVVITSLANNMKFKSSVGGGHGGAGETSWIMYLRPDLVKSKMPVDPPSAHKWRPIPEELEGFNIRHLYENSEPTSASVWLTWATPMHVGIGVVPPTKGANAEEGKRFIEAATSGLLKLVKGMDKL